MNEQQHQNDEQDDGQDPPVHVKKPIPDENQEHQTSQQADQDFREAVNQKVADEPQNAGQDDSRTSQPALEEDEESLAKPENS